MSRTLQLLREMTWKYAPQYPDAHDDSLVECGYCSQQLAVDEFHEPKSHLKFCTFAAAMRHLAAIEAAQPAAGEGEGEGE